MVTEKLFPIQRDHGRLAGEGNLLLPGENWQREPGWVPWAVAEAAYRVYVKRYGRDQSLEVLASRGGFSWSELVGLLRGDDPIQTLAFQEPEKQINGR